VVAKVREIFDGERFNHRKVNKLEVRKEYQTEITNRFEALENLRNGEDIKRLWGKMKENIKTSGKGSLDLHELKQHKPRFDEECSGFLDQGTQAKMQQVQDPSQNNVDNLNSVRLRREDSKHFSNKKEKYLKHEKEELEPNSKIKMLERTS
jgi:hypothetical protein